MYRFDDETIHIENLRVECIVGIHPHEREQPQPLLIALSVPWDFAPAAASEDVAHTLDYSALAEAAARFVVAGRFRLLETLARELARHLAERFGLGALHVHVRKPQAVASSTGSEASLTLRRTVDEGA